MQRKRAVRAEQLQTVRRLDEMPRPPRLQLAGGLYHVGTRGVRRSRIFWGDGDQQFFCRILENVVGRFEWQCHTYCLMPNHYHVVLETRKPNLSAGMQRLNSVFAQWFNAEHGFTGHVFERRFFSRIVESTFDLFELARYVVLNPVRAGLCAEPGDWEWSSYRALVGDAPAAPFLTTGQLLGQFCPEPQRAGEIFRTFVDEAQPRGH